VILTRLLRTSSFRLAVMYMVLFSLSVLVLLGFIYWTTAGFMERQTDETINAEIQGLHERYKLLGLAGLVLVINERLENDEGESSIYLLTDRNFSAIAGNLEAWPRAVVNTQGWFNFSYSPEDKKEEHMARGRHLLLTGGFHLLVGRDVSDRVQVQNVIIESLGWGLAITVILGLFGGVFISRSMLRRVDSINRAVREIIQGNLTRRFPVTGIDDEFDQLTRNLNDMLDRIERLMSGVRQVSDNIAHDLRSPLNRLRGRLEVALMQKQGEEEYKEAIAQTIQETDEIISTFNALLKIAQAEAGARREDFVDVDLCTLARDMAELYEPLAEEKGLDFTVDVAPCVTLPGNRHLLSQAIANLLDNAIKYTDSGGVSLRLETGRNGPELVVADTGPGVLPELRGKVLERFQRLETSRSTPGSGLGLSLVSAVATLHDAELRLEDNQPGLRAVLAFPNTK
jgi:signal transduction histidine kinase